MTIAGALSFLPGGLGVAGDRHGQAANIAQAHGVFRADGGGRDVRDAGLCTLWFAVIIGGIALVIVQRRTRVDLSHLERRSAG